ENSHAVVPAPAGAAAVLARPLDRRPDRDPRQHRLRHGGRGPMSVPETTTLTPEEAAEIERELAHYERKRAACIDTLKIVQRRRGWVPDDALRGIADLLGMPVDELDAVATFYNLIYRRPVGRHVVHFCDSVSCWLMGTDAITERLRQRFGVAPGETDPDG